MWRGNRKRNSVVMVGADEFDHTDIVKVANRRCSAIVEAHVRRDSRLSNIAVDCYLQGVRDATETIVKSGATITFAPQTGE